MRFSEFVERFEWYLGGKADTCLYFRHAGRWRKRSWAPVTRSSEATIGYIELFLALTCGKVLLLSEGPISKRLDAWFSWKFFLTNWYGHFTAGAWRFAAAREDRPLSRLRTSFRKADQLPRGTECVVLGNGPSAHLALDEEFADCDFIICNTAIKSDALLRRRIVALCIADAVYFAAPHDYARALHARMREVLPAKDISLYVDAEQEELWNYRIGDLSAERVFPVLFNPYIPYQANFRDGRIQKNGYSVFTMMLLPLAATYYRKVHLVGFDGKSPDVSNYFWRHNDEFQYSGLLPTVMASEPAFFRQKNYEDYSRANETSIAEALACVQKSGVELVMSHPSFIAPLQDLYLRGGTRLARLSPARAPCVD